MSKHKKRLMELREQFASLKARMESDMGRPFPDYDKASSLLANILSILELLQENQSERSPHTLLYELSNLANRLEDLKSGGCPTEDELDAIDHEFAQLLTSQPRVKLAYLIVFDRWYAATIARVLRSLDEKAQQAALDEADLGRQCKYKEKLARLESSIAENLRKFQTA